MKPSLPVKEPLSQAGVKAPRIKPPKYIIKKEPDFNVEHAVMSITNGLPMKSVQPELYELLYPYLQIKRDKLVRDENIYAIQVVNKAIEDIEVYYQEQLEEKENRLMKEMAREQYELQKAKREEERRKRLHIFTKKEIDDNVDLAISGCYDQIDENIFKPLTAELRKLHKVAVKRDDLNTASMYDDAARKIISIGNSHKYGELANAKVQEYDKKVNIMKKELKTLQEDWDNKINEAKLIRDEDIRNLNREAQLRMIQFDELLANELPSQYKKYSSAYLNLRKKEKTLMTLKNFEEANEIKKYADSIQAKEDQEFRERYEADLELKRKDCLKKIQDKINVRVENSDLQLLQMQREAEREIGQAKRALNRYQIHQREAEQMAFYANIDSDESKKSVSSSSFSNMSSLSDSSRPLSGRRPLKIKINNNIDNENYNWKSKNNRTINSARDRDSQRAQWVKDIKTPRAFQEEKNSQDLFRQRRAINNMIYSKGGHPHVRRVPRKEY
ncbi:hypothetical protein M9Y10_045748 [Tritrichomonas musculus]|uniref:Uncharacterized protein n=1 Tax=Tritrichomonas musculus TaxID=1915356 RepID=A0ABR2JZ24_9EUKA